MSEDGARRGEPPQGALARARLGDRDAFAALYERHAEDVGRLCRRLLGSAVDAEDARHEVFLKASAGFAGYDRARPFRRWLLAVAAHHCVDRLRRRGTERSLFEPLAEDAATAPPQDSPLRATLAAESRLALLAALDGLPARYRAPLVMRYFADLSYAEIADGLAIPVPQVGVLLHRGRLRLRRALSEDGEADPEGSP